MDSSLTAVVANAAFDSLDDAMLGRPCRCGSSHSPQPDCYVPADVMAVLRENAPDGCLHAYLSGMSVCYYCGESA